MNIEHYIRIGRLLAELHGDEVLSEQQCAKIMGVDLVSWRIIEHTFCRGSWGETVDESGPTSEGAILAALPELSTESVDKPVHKLSDEQINAGWHATFSTNNPFCPCDLRTFTKAVRWAELAIKRGATQ